MNKTFNFPYLLLEDEEWVYALDSINYAVSNLGRVFSIRRGLLLKPVLAKGCREYPRVWIDGKKEKLHKIVWISFNGPIKTGLVIRHLNDNREDNRLVNLSIGSQRENVFDARNNGILTKTLSISDAENIVELRNLGFSQREISEKLNLPFTNVGSVLYENAFNLQDKIKLKGNKLHLSKEQVFEILTKLKLGISRKEIVKALDLKKHVVDDVASGRAYLAFIEEFKRDG